MATETPGNGSGEHSVRIEHLQRDRQSLAHRLGEQHWFGPGQGLAAGLLAAGPAVRDDLWRGILVGTALLASIALVYRYRRATGIKLSRVSASTASIYAAALAMTLILLSVSYGLAASGLTWWITATAAIAFVAVTWLVRLFVAAVIDHVSHGI